jgi:hypothetical protein
MIALFGMDRVALVTTFGLCSLSFCEEDCFEFELLVLEWLVVVDGPNNESNESFFVCRAGWLVGFVENISSGSVRRGAAGLLELLAKRDSNGSATGLGCVVVVVGCAVINRVHCLYVEE